MAPTHNPEQAPGGGLYGPESAQTPAAGIERRPTPRSGTQAGTQSLDDPEPTPQTPNGAREPETSHSPTQSREEPAGRSCADFPDHCPNLRDVEPSPPSHYGGIRCGCHDLEPTPEPDARRERYAAALLGPDASGTLDPAADDTITAVIVIADAEQRALKTAHIALAEQAGKDQAENARLRAAFNALYERWFVNAHAGTSLRQFAEGVGRDIRAALDGGTDD